MKTENPEHVGKHAFEVAGLGLAPFRFVGMSENVLNFPDGSSKAGGCCDYCASGIRFEFHIMSADGKVSKVGCDCIAKVADEGLLKAYKASPEYRAKERAKRAAKAKVVFDELRALIAAKVDVLAAMPHPYGFNDRKTGKPLTRLDYVNFMVNASGAAGRKGLLVWMKNNVA